jgi:hypothetical protein
MVLAGPLLKPIAYSAHQGPICEMNGTLMARPAWRTLGMMTLTLHGLLTSHDQIRQAPHCHLPQRPPLVAVVPNALASGCQ